MAGKYERKQHHLMELEDEYTQLEIVKRARDMEVREAEVSYPKIHS